MEIKKTQELIEAGLAEFGRGNWEAAKRIFQEVKSVDSGNRQASDYLEYMADQERADREELGDLKRIPVVALSAKEILQLNLSPRTGYILSLTDGFLTFEEIIATSGLGQHETRRELARLRRMKIIQVV